MPPTADIEGEELVAAARCGDVPSIISLLEELGVGVDYETRDGESALIAATQGGHLEAVEALLARGASVDRESRTGNTALRAATLLGDGGLIDALVAAGAAVDLESSRGTALMAAAGQGDAESCLMLLDRGASVDLEARGGATALRVAVREQRREVIQVLLARGADPLKDNADGKSAVAVAEERGLAGELAILAKHAITITADRAIEGSERRQEEARAEAAANQVERARQIEKDMAVLKVESDAKVSSIRAENDDLMARFGHLRKR